MKNIRQNSKVSRRNFIQSTTLATAGLACLPITSKAAPGDRVWTALKEIGQLKTSSGRDIASSRFSVGFECLDRGMFDPERVYPHVARLGVKWARVQTGWARCEKEKGRYDFAWLDRIVDSLRAVGVQPWFNVGYGNRLYTPDAPHETAIGWSPIFAEEARNGWGQFAGALAEHYRGRVSRFEVWNEPDYTAFWAPGKPSGRQYAELVALTSKAIREKMPQATILGGSIAFLKKMTFLEDCFAAGMADHIDALTYHLYPPTPETFYETSLPALRDLLKRVAPKLPAWQGESGAPSLGQLGQALGKYEWNEQKQAKWDARRTLLDLAFDVPFISCFHASDFMFYIVKDQIVHKRYYFGLVGGDNYEPKPAYYGYQTLCTLFAGNVKRSTDLNILFPAVLKRQPAETVSPRGYAFETERGAIFAYWQPHDMMQTFEPRGTTVEIRGPKSQLPKNPVLLDPVSQTVLSTHKIERLAGGGFRLDGMPLTDSPILIADRDALPIAQSKA